MRSRVYLHTGVDTRWVGARLNEIFRHADSPDRQMQSSSINFIYSTLSINRCRGEKVYSFQRMQSTFARGKKEKTHDGSETCKSRVHAYSYAMRCKRYTPCVFYKSCGHIDFMKAMPLAVSFGACAFLQYFELKIKLDNISDFFLKFGFLPSSLLVPLANSKEIKKRSKLCLRPNGVKLRTNDKHKCYA
jgi:hypothetical protein